MDLPRLHVDMFCGRTYTFNHIGDIPEGYTVLVDGLHPLTKDHSFWPMQRWRALVSTGPVYFRILSTNQRIWSLSSRQSVSSGSFASFQTLHKILASCLALPTSGILWLAKSLTWASHIHLLFPGCGCSTIIRFCCANGRWKHFDLPLAKRTTYSDSEIKNWFPILWHAHISWKM